MPDAGAIQTLRAVFRGEIEGHRALLAVLKAEQEALRTANAEAVALASHDKIRHIKELEALARQRTELMISLGLALTPLGVETGHLPAQHAEAIRADWSLLRTTAAAAQQANALNGRLIARHQRHCESALAKLLEAAGGAPVYGADGRHQPGLPPRTLAAI